MTVLYVVAKTPVIIIEQSAGLFFLYKGNLADSPEFSARLKPVSVESRRLVGVIDHSHYLLEQDDLPPIMRALVLTPQEKTAIADDVKQRWGSAVRQVFTAFPIAVACVYQKNLTAVEAARYPSSKGWFATLSVSAYQHITHPVEELGEHCHGLRFNGEKTEVVSLPLFQ